MVSREDWACVLLIIVGAISFLYGANYYNSFVGWFGLFLFVGGFLALIALYVYSELEKRVRKAPSDEPEIQNP